MVGLLAARPGATGAERRVAAPVLLPSAVRADGASSWSRPAAQAEALASLQRFLGGPPSPPAADGHTVPVWQIALREAALFEKTTPPALRAPSRVLLAHLAHFLESQRADAWSLAIVGSSADPVTDGLDLVRAELVRLGAPEGRVACGFNAALGEGITLLQLERRPGNGMVAAR